MKPAENTNKLGVEGAFDVLSRARALEARGHQIIHLEIGEPDFPTPVHIVEAGKKALDDGFTHYGPTMGLPELRDAIAADVFATRRIEVDASQVCVTPGAKPALFYAMAAVLNPGDEVLVPDPGFPIYASLARYLGAIPVAVPLLESTQFGFDLQFLADHLTARTKMVILNSPHNPTGSVMSLADLDALAGLLRDRDVVVVSDEIYKTIFFGTDPPASISSISGMAEKTILIDGFSKSHAMTGWRLGYGVYPKWLTETVSRLMVNTNSCTASFVQKAGVAALTGPQTDCQQMVEQFRARRDLFVTGLNSIPGFTCTVPLGAFYAYPNISATGMTSKQLEDSLLRVAGVACLAGTAFGGSGTPQLRFSMANSLENMALAITKIDHWIRIKPVLQ